MSRSKKEKCLTCKHPLEEHIGELCLHWNWDIQSRCKCNSGSDGVPLNKTFGKYRVLEVVIAGNNAVVFSSVDGKYWRWMFKQKQIFPFEV
jgi:hypothetical protein